MFDITEKVRSDGVKILACTPQGVHYPFTPIEIWITSIGVEFGAVVMFCGFNNIGHLPFKRSEEAAFVQARRFLEKWHMNPCDYFNAPATLRRL